MKTSKLNIFIFFILISTLLNAQFNSNSTTLLQANSEIKIEKAEYIDSRTINLHINIPEGYYAYLSSKIANKITISPADKTKINFKTIYDSGVKKGDDLIIYGRQIFQLKLNKEIQNGDYDILLDYQLCREADNICLPPQKKIINLSIDNNSISLNYTDSLPKGSKISADDNSLVSKIKNNSNVAFTLLLIFLAGIASILLPCTYPLISITISLIGIEGKDGKREAKQSIISSALFSLGIITTYTLLGAIVSIAGSVFNKNILFGSIGYNPIVLSVIVILFLYFTFSMAGFYDIKIPQFLNKIRSSTFNKNRGSVLYKYVIGLIAGVVATPCAAPVIALILEISFLNPTYGVLYMATYAFGFSIVLFILSVSMKTIISKLPSAGEWMNYIRLVFSFVMLLVSYYYLEILLKNIGLIKISPMLSGVVIFIISFLIFFILNKKEKILLTPKEIKIFFTTLVLGILIATTYTTIKDININKETISIKDAITLAEKEDKKILIDFYAIWCENCYILDKNVLSSPLMKSYLNDNNYILVKVDVDKESKLAKEFSVKWLPWIIVVDSEKNILYQKNSFESFDDKTTLNIINDLKKIEIK